VRNQDALWAERQHADNLNDHVERDADDHTDDHNLLVVDEHYRPGKSGAPLHGLSAAAQYSR
jgi:hypothetical protein